jgi:hypothetical protein
MSAPDCTDKSAMLPVQQHAEKLFIEYIRRLQPLVHDHRVTLLDVIRTARELAQDAQLLTKIAADEGCVHTAELGQVLDIRTQHFKRFVLHHLFKTTEPEFARQQHEALRQWLLHLIEVIEIAVGQFRFQEAQQFCETLIQSQKAEGTFTFHHFLADESVMQHYVLLFFQLAIFLEAKPKHRIAWLLHSMESNPTSRVEYGMEIHINKAIEAPTEAQIAQLLIIIFKHLLDYVNHHEMSEALLHKFPQLAIEPLALLKQLIQDLRLAHPSV